jgi:hypothetical protein
MARRDPTLVYVHGAGAQPPEADWVRIHNQILFADRPAPPTDLAYYADLIQQFDDPGAGSPVAEPATAKDVLQDSIHQTVAGEGRTHEAHLFLLRLAAAMGPPTIARVSPCPDTSSRRPCATSTGKCPATSLRVHATEVRNEAEWHHAFSGYLETPEVRDAIYARLSERARAPLAQPRRRPGGPKT